MFLESGTSGVKARSENEPCPISCLTKGHMSSGRDKGKGRRRNEEGGKEEEDTEERGG